MGGQLWAARCFPEVQGTWGRDKRYGGGSDTERGTGSGGFPISSFPTPSHLNLSQPLSTESTRLCTIIRTMVAMTTGVDFVSIFSTDCKERGSLR